MRRRGRIRHSSGKGFTLLETMIVLVLLMIIMAAIFQQIGEAQARSATEQARLDLFQESREFMDQLTRDLRDSGYPNSRNFAMGQLTAAPAKNDSSVAVGLVKADANSLWFEALQPSQDGTGLEVHSIQYTLSSTGPNCPCLQRSEVVKQTDTNPSAQTPTLRLEVQNVANSTQGIPIFRYYKEYDPSDPSAPLEITAVPVNIDNNSDVVATISTVQVTVVVQSPYPDLKTGQRPVMTLVSAMRLRNCSPGEGGTMSCSANAFNSF